MKSGDQPFVVGRKTRNGTTVVLVRGEERPAATGRAPGIRGPWTLEAVVTPGPGS